jgi:hypothetical protein
MPWLIRGLTGRKIKSALTQGLAYVGVYNVAAGTKEVVEEVTNKEKMVIWGGVAFIILLLLRK